MLNRLWSWTSAPDVPATSGVPVGALRFRQWTSAPAGADAVTGVPLGALRLRQWTSAAASPGTPAITGIPIGPLRVRAWTSAALVPVVVQGGGAGPIRIPVDNRLERLRLQRDDELMTFVAAAAASLGLLD